ncbi:MAG: stage III sporulation protein AE [Clostridia bacterium]|nr:stage III sporulation protein AE [Clostridia bacterium]
MKKILLHILIIFFLIFFSATKVNAESLTSQMIQQEKESFGISSFIDETKKYTNDFFEDMNISDVLNSAITGEIDNNKILKKILKIFGKEIVSSLKTIIAVLVIVLIHSIIKAVADNLETSNISKTIYYVQYILIVTVVMSNFSDLIFSITNTIQNLVGFMNSLVPLLITLMIYTGNIATSSLLEPIILLIIEFISNIILTLILPGVSIITALIIVSKLSNKVQIGKLTKFFKTSIVWVLGIILTIFVGVVSLEGTLASSVDGITAKTAKAAVSSMIPVVGKILGDSVDSVLGCGLVLKNALGVVGVLIIIGICATPIIKLSILTIMYSLSSAIIEPLADEKIVKLLEDFSSIFKLLLGILCATSVLLIIGITLVIKISNSGMMYR